MALALPRRLLTSSIKLPFKKPPQPYACYLLTKQGFSNNNPKQTYSFRSMNNLYGLSESLRYYATKRTEEYEEPEEKKLSLFQKFKRMYRDYWYVLVPVHLVTSAAWFGGFYYLASSGVDIPSLLESLNFNERIVNSMRGSNMGYYAITYGLYKIATPIRYTVTLGGTTVAINYLKKWGYIKPMPSKERLKEMYVETKEGMKEKKENLIESVHHLQQTVKETKEGIKEKKDSIVSTVKESKQSIKSIKEKVIGDSTGKPQGK